MNFKKERNPKMENTQNEIYKHYIALDWSQKIVAIAVMRDNGSKVDVKEIPPDTKLLKQHLKSYPGRKILTVEETTTSQWLYVELKDSVDKFLICDPYRNSLLKDGPKTDKIDSANLCMLLRSGMLKEVFHTCGKLYELRKLVSAYEDFIKASVQFKNQRSALFRAEGKSHKKSEQLESNELTSFVNLKQIEIIDHISEIRKEFEKKFLKISKEQKVIRQLMKISGIGLKTAVEIFSVVIDADRFDNKYKYWAYSGLVKYQKESGGRNYGSKQIRHSRILKKSYKIAAMAAIGGKNDIREYYDYLLKKGNNFEEARNQISRYIAKVSYAVMKSKIDYRVYQWKEGLRT